MKKNNTLAAALFFLGVLLIIIFFPTQTPKETPDMTKIHKLKSPIFIENENNSGYYMLPKGTVLYYDGSMDEGFSRYRLYLNVYGKPLELSENTSEAIMPSGATAIDKAQLLSILKSAILDTEDIKLIIENGNFSEDDKKEFIKQLNKK